MRETHAFEVMYRVTVLMSSSVCQELERPAASLPWNGGENNSLNIGVRDIGAVPLQFILMEIFESATSLMNAPGGREGNPHLDTKAILVLIDLLVVRRITGSDPISKSAFAKQIGNNIRSHYNLCIYILTGAI